MWKEVQYLRSIYGPVREVYLLDTSWLLHRYYHSHKHLSADVGGDKPVPTGEIYGVLNQVAMISKKNPYAAIVLCLDSPSSKRKEIFPEYKAQREAHPEVYSKLTELLHASQLLPHVFVSYKEGEEADDLIYSLASYLGGAPNLEGKTIQVYIYSRDKDLFQAVRANVYTFDVLKRGRPKELKSAEYVIDKMGVPPEKVAFYRAIRADDVSDNIKKYYPRFPTTLLLKIINDPDNTDPETLAKRLTPSFIKAKFSKKEWKWVEKIAKSPEGMLLNYRLIKLERLDRPYIYRGEGSWTPLRKYLMRATEQNFKDILEEVRPLKESSSPG